MNVSLEWSTKRTANHRHRDPQWASPISQEGGKRQQSCSMNSLISFGAAKIASARSPIIPAGMSAGAPFLRTVLLLSTIVEARPEGARMAIIRRDAKGVSAITDGTHALLRTNALQIDVPPLIIPPVRGGACPPA